MKAKYKIQQVKLSYVRELENYYPVANCAEVLCKIFRDSYDYGDIDNVEYFKVIYLANNLKPLGVHTVSMGSSDATVVDMKTIFCGALLAKASRIAVCHNHPSGSLRPSRHDEELTHKINEAGKLLDIKLVDHIILTSDWYYSFQEEGKIL